MIKKIFYISIITIIATLFLIPSNIQAAPAPSDPCTTALTTMAGSANVYKAASLANKILPLIPDELNSTATAVAGATTPCTPSLWNSNVLKYFLFKSLFILNWLAEALFIILILYGGVLYIMGYMNENNVKKAKSTLRAAITGLVIVLAARYIVDGAITIFSDNNARTTITGADYYKN